MTDKVKEACERLVEHIHNDAEDFDVGQKLIDEFADGTQEAVHNIVEGIDEPIVMVTALLAIVDAAFRMVGELGALEKEAFFEILNDNGYDVKFMSGSGNE